MRKQPWNFSKGRRFFPAMLFFLAAVTCPHSASGAFYEYEIKAGFLYQFTQFVEWPEEVLERINENFRLCLFGGNPFGDILETLEGEKVHGRQIKVWHLQTWQEADACHAVFISRSSAHEIRKALHHLAGKPVLTVSEIKGFIDHGGVINFLREGRNIRFEINQHSAEKAGLKISSKLLKLASRVIP